MKEKLLEKLQKQVEIFECQKDSNEYKDAVDVYERVLKADTTKLEDKLSNFEMQGADCFLNVWGKNGMFRIYGNAIYKSGFKPKFNDNFINI